MLAAGKVALMVLLRCMAAELMAGRMLAEGVLELMADLLADLMIAQLAELAVVDLIAELSGVRAASR